MTGPTSFLPRVFKETCFTFLSKAYGRYYFQIFKMNIDLLSFATFFCFLGNSSSMSAKTGHTVSYLIKNVIFFAT